ALADSVQEVIELEPAQIEPPPKIGTRLKTEFIKGIGKRENEFIMILDIDKVFSMDELDMVTEAGTTMEAAM
ncbi:MAG: chemotaxis protein CheW, partial [Syntrophorhabdus aromaticivorans]|nr:chemotaxis protein CheW [Syntrophorhabdus aromaticivorans]